MQEEKDLTRVHQNHVYLWDTINNESVLDTIENMSAAYRYVWGQQHNPGHTPTDADIFLHINSGGGWLHSGFAMADCIQRFKYDITGVGSGYVCSSASIIFVACKRRLISPSTWLLIHPHRTSTHGYETYTAAVDNRKYDDGLHELMIKHYVQHTRATREKIEEILKAETWLTASEAVELGFADEVLE